MDISIILSVIYTKISASTSTEEVLILSKIAEKIKIGNVRVVSTYGEMLLASSISDGSVFFVESEENLYFQYGPNKILMLNFTSGVFSWGLNTYGRLGDNTVVAKSSPVSVVGRFTDWIQVSAGSGHSLGIRSNGTAWSWGRNNYGQLGDNVGTTLSRSSPVSVVGGFTDWVQLSAGNLHNLGIRSNGTAWAWGAGTYGRLGDNTVVAKSSPVSVVGGFTDWVQLSAGNSHNLGIRTNGTAWSWGANNNGQLGDNTTISKSSPVSVVGGFTDWIQVSAGGYHSLGIRSNGTAWSWGYNTSGRLGDGTQAAKSSPVSVVGGFTDWIQVSAGGYHSLGIRSNGTAWAWGRNNYGQLGDNTNVLKTSPVSVVGGFTDWVQLSAGGSFSLGLRSNGTAWSWGLNSFGALGDNTIVSKSSPVSVVGGFADWVQVSAGNGHSLAIRTFR